MYRRLLALLAVVTIVSAATAAVVMASGKSLPSDVQAVRAAVARYHSYSQALADGYILPPNEPCISSPAGAMGFHLINPKLMADPAIDPLHPEIVLYVPDADGTLRFAAVEYFKADADGDLSTDSDRPTALGHAFDGPMPGHNPAMPVHYDLHVWLAQDNPKGLFTQFNPAVSCGGAG